MTMWNNLTQGFLHNGYLENSTRKPAERTVEFYKLIRLPPLTHAIFQKPLFTEADTRYKIPKPV